MIYHDIYSYHRSEEPDVETILCINVDDTTEDLVDDLPCSVGVSPRSINDNVDDVLYIAQDIASEPTVIAIGGAGLDRSIPIGWVDQMRVFEDQIAFSELHCKPMVLHCVRAHADVVTLRRELQAAQPWIIHAFDKGADTLDRIIEAGLYVSFGTAVLNEGSQAALSATSVTIERLFLETGSDTDVNIKAIYSHVAGLRGVSVEQLCEAIQHNYDTVFKQ